MTKQDGAFLTIGELSRKLGVPHHILRYWETRFPALRPLQRAGGRRYYRPEDVALAQNIHHLLNVEGYTINGAQKAIAGKSAVLSVDKGGVSKESVESDATGRSAADEADYSVGGTSRRLASVMMDNDPKGPFPDRQQMMQRLSNIQGKLALLLNDTL